MGARSKGKDNGALILVARDGDRALRIEVGYGLEGKLTDIYAGRIVRDIMVPKLRAGDSSGAIEAGALRQFSAFLAGMQPSKRS